MVDQELPCDTKAVAMRGPMVPPMPYEPWKAPRVVVALAKFAQKVLLGARLKASPSPTKK